MIERLIPPIGSRKNNLTSETVGAYIAAVIYEPTRPLIRRIINGDEPEYFVSNKNMAAILGCILDEPATDENMERWAKALVSNITSPIYHRTKNKPAHARKDIPKAVLPDDPHNQQLWDLLQKLSNYLGGSGEVVSFSLDINTEMGDTLMLRSDV